MKAIGIIPARLHSTRLPRKLLLSETGKPLLAHTWEAASRCKALERIVIAADGPEIADAARAFGADVVLTGEHASGTDRVAEAAASMEADVIVNIQGDEPALDPDSLRLLVAELEQHPAAEMATLAAPLPDAERALDEAAVKVARASDGRALYFSRARIPHVRGGLATGAAPPWLLHVGVYAYRRDYLMRLASLPPSPLEQWEKLEQLRALEDGAVIRVAVVAHAGEGIDTPQDYARFTSRYLAEQE